MFPFMLPEINSETSNYSLDDGSKPSGPGEINPRDILLKSIQY